MIGKQRLYFIQNFLSDGRLVRILGRDGTERVIPLMRDATVGNMTCEIDDAPSAPNQKEANWAIISQMLPLVARMMTPELWLAVLEYSPLPSALVEKLRRDPRAGRASPEQKQQAMVALQSALAKIKVTRPPPPRTPPALPSRRPRPKRRRSSRRASYASPSAFRSPIAGFARRPRECRLRIHHVTRTR